MGQYIESVVMLPFRGNIKSYSFIHFSNNASGKILEERISLLKADKERAENLVKSKQAQIEDLNSEIKSEDFYASVKNLYLQDKQKK